MKKLCLGIILMIGLLPFPLMGATSNAKPLKGDFYKSLQSQEISSLIEE